MIGTHLSFVFLSAVSALLCNNHRHVADIQLHLSPNCMVRHQQSWEINGTITLHVDLRLWFVGLAFVWLNSRVAVMIPLSQQHPRTCERTWKSGEVTVQHRKFNGW